MKGRRIISPNTDGGAVRFWRSFRKQLRWIVPLMLLVLVHELGSKAAGQKLDRADWPKGAENQPDLQRGMPINWYLAIRPDPDRKGKAHAAAKESQVSDDEDGQDLESPLPESGVLCDISFIYNKPFHAIVMLVVAACLAAWLVRVHPIFILPVMVYTFSKVQEFYPVTNWPMYSNPSMGPSWYCYLADGEGKALPVRELCGETAPKLKKRMRTYTEDLLKDDRYKGLKGRDELPDQAWEQCAQKVLKEMSQRAVEEGNVDELPSRLQLYRVDIYQEKGSFREDPQLLGTISTAGLVPAQSSADAPRPNRKQRELNPSNQSL